MSESESAHLSAPSRLLGKENVPLETRQGTNICLKLWVARNPEDVNVTSSIRV